MLSTFTLFISLALRSTAFSVVPASFLGALQEDRDSGYAVEEVQVNASRNAVEEAQVSALGNAVEEAQASDSVNAVDEAQASDSGHAVDEAQVSASGNGLEEAQASDSVNGVEEAQASDSVNGAEAAQVSDSGHAVEEAQVSDSGNGVEEAQVSDRILEEEATSNRKTVWIPSWPRSGSTTVFHMVLAAASESEDANDDVARALEDRGRGEQLFIPQTVPTDPGCWHLNPTGCQRFAQDQSLAEGQNNAQQWTRDSILGAHTSWTACEGRRSAKNAYCNVTDTATLFVPAYDYAASPFKRHFGLFEPCHKRFSTLTQPDRVSSELKGNCDLTMQRLFRCDFTGIEYLWGWTRPHSDITGVTTLGADPPKFTPELATRACRISDLHVFKTVDDYGRNVTDALTMLGRFPELKVVVPVRDPRAIYASWKELPWDFPGPSLMKEICDQMSLAAQIKHDRLYRVVFERLLANPEVVMRRVYDFLGFSFGTAQQRWISRTFNANCSNTAEQGNRFYSCHEDSQVPLNRWKDVLNNTEKWIYNNYPSCNQITQLYGFEEIVAPAV